MVAAMLVLTMPVINTACVMVTVAYLLMRTQKDFTILQAGNSTKKRFLLIVLFGIFTIYAGYNSIPVDGAVVSLRHTGPILAGLVGGPVVGLVTGGIGVFNRVLQEGLSGTWKSAVLALLLSGLLSGLFSIVLKKDNSVKIWKIVVFTAIYELFSTGLTFIFTSDFETALMIEKNVRLSLIIGNTIAVAIFMFYIKNLTEEKHNKEIKEQIEYELNVARSIQMSMVPKIFPAFPEVQEIEVFALLEPAKEVGGDLYDFFYIDDDHFCFVVGDVSGKGVPASLFMAVTKTLIQAKAGRRSSAEILFQVNNELCKGNAQDMFVTVFCGILDIRTGEIEFSNAGHTKPYLYKMDGTVEVITPNAGIALGVMTDFIYYQEKLVMSSGDALILYTDGVTEAMSVENELFSEQRLESAVKQTTGNASAKEITYSIAEKVEEFADNAAQFDDITILVLKYFG